MRRPTFMCIVLLSVLLTAMPTSASDNMKTGSALGIGQ